MNCIDLAYRHTLNTPDKCAIWMPRINGGIGVTFAELFEEARSVQGQLLQRGTLPGETILLVDTLHPRLYAAVIGILGLGCTVALVEPWMQIHRVDEVIRTINPRTFVAGRFGQLWGTRVGSIRTIPNWIYPGSAVRKINNHALQVTPVDVEAPAILTFTSGTTGTPKGVVRTHRFLIDQYRVLDHVFDYREHDGPDLCIFANFTFANLASGRTTILVPPGWRSYHLNKLDQLPEPLQPQTLTCGPAFLLKLMRHARVPSLQSIHVGGALTDCWIFESGFTRWPDARWIHVYGSTEAEPVALADARDAVERSRSRGYFQTLNLGRPVNDINIKTAQDGAWVNGPHVCPKYIGNERANLNNKRKDDAGGTWHFMGDRLEQDEEGCLWYRGRSDQAGEDFELEQRLYATLQSSKSFVYRTAAGKKLLVGEVPVTFKHADIDAVHPTRIRRDRRHRARIDRHRTLKMR